MYSLKVLSDVLIYLIDFDAQYLSSFIPGLPLKNSFQMILYAFQKFYIISDQQYVNHIYLSEIL